jgi:hypothetical protein
MKKFQLNAIAAAALGFAASGAFAVVDIDLSPAVPAVYASEIIATAAAPISLAGGATNATDITVLTGYAFSPAEVRYARFEVTNGVFDTAGAPLVAGGTPGLINGLGTSVIYFSITAGAGGVASNAALTLNAMGIKITGTSSNMTVSYSLYDQPSQAQAGGSTGRIVNKADKAYITFAPSYQVAVTAGSAIADVEASPSFTKFVPQIAPGPNSALTAGLAKLDYKLATTVPLTSAGVAMTLPTLMAAGTKLVVSGDWSDAANNDGTFTVAALNRVFLSALQDCSAVTLAVSSVSATAATFNVGSTATTGNPWLCYTPNNLAGNTAAIPASTYTAVLNAVSATPATYAVASQDKGKVSEITHNGTELQATYFSTDGLYLSRFFLTNKGGTDASYTTKVTTENGVTCNPGTGATGTIKAGQLLNVDATGAAGVCASFTGNPPGSASTATRAAVTFNIAAPNNAIQGTYQIVNKTSLGLNVSQMVRPGTN